MSPEYIRTQGNESFLEFKNTDSDAPLSLSSKHGSRHLSTAGLAETLRS